MSIQHSQKFCDRCNEYVLAERNGPNHILHLLLSIITGGLWIIVWIMQSVQVGGWKCSKCGSSANKLFTTKDISIQKQPATYGSSEPETIKANYSIGLPVSLIIVGIGVVTSGIIHNDLVTLFFGISLSVVALLLFLGRDK